MYCFMVLSLMFQRCSDPAKHVSLFGRMRKTSLLIILSVSLKQLQRVTSLKQTNHDRISHMAQAKAALEVKQFLMANSLEKLNKKLDKYYMVLILKNLHSDFDNFRGQILVCGQILYMDGLITRLTMIVVSSLMYCCCSRCLFQVLLQYSKEVLLFCILYISGLRYTSFNHSLAYRLRHPLNVPIIHILSLLIKKKKKFVCLN